jgi:hypothetical protein
MNPARRRTGFTLLELVTAMGMLGIGVFAVVTSFHYGLEKVRAVCISCTAQTVAQNELEKLRAAPYDELKLTEGTPLPATPALEKLVKVSMGKRVQVYGEPKLGLREVEVRISWIGDGARPMYASALTLVGNKGGAVK